MNETETKRPDRLSTVLEMPRQPDSLVGCFFLGNASNGWQGCVVAEVAPQVYLVELFEWLIGTSSEQRLVRLNNMMDWHFFDSAVWMRNSSEDIQGQWELQRARK